jgi:prepilin-type N-terminal cleavage/methylation domain-containing protein/prepilin-type processing-associated H-X9-DG protein
MNRRFRISECAPPSVDPRSGLTLVEMLVVVAIIGMLVALLLPAVQSARESARRSQCSSNLRQLALGVQSFNQSMGRLPPGAAGPFRPFLPSDHTGVNSQWGVSWLVYLLPMVEQSAMFSKLVFITSVGANNDSITALGEVLIPTYACPSSPLPVFEGTVLPRVMVSHYAGIAGAAPEIWKTDTALWAKCRVNDLGTSATCCASGRVSGGGALIPAGQLTYGSFRDGTSATLMISEQSDYLLTDSGQRVPWRASGSGRIGFLFGGAGKSPPPAWNYTASENRAGSTTTIRYAINNKTNGGAGWAAGSPQATLDFPFGNCATGVCGATGANTPLNSAHAGGVSAAFADGSVRFIDESIDMTTLSRLAIRDDGGLIGDF